MRLLKSSQNKENIINHPTQHHDKPKIDELRHQLKHAHAEIATLKDSNH